MIGCFFKKCLSQVRKEVSVAAKRRSLADAHLASAIKAAAATGAAVAAAARRAAAATHTDRRAKALSLAAVTAAAAAAAEAEAEAEAKAEAKVETVAQPAVGPGGSGTQAFFSHSPPQLAPQPPTPPLQPQAFKTPAPAESAAARTKEVRKSFNALDAVRCVILWTRQDCQQ